MGLRPTFVFGLILSPIYKPIFRTNLGPIQARGQLKLNQGRPKTAGPHQHAYKPAGCSPVYFLTQMARQLKAQQTTAFSSISHGHGQLKHTSSPTWAPNVRPQPSSHAGLANSLDAHVHGHVTVPNDLPLACSSQCPISMPQ